MDLALARSSDGKRKEEGRKGKGEERYSNIITSEVMLLESHLTVC